MAISVLIVIIFFKFDNLREKKSMPLTKQSGIAHFKTSCPTPVENCCPRLKWCQMLVLECGCWQKYGQRIQTSNKVTLSFFRIKFCPS